MADQDKRPEGDEQQKSRRRRQPTAATELVKIAAELYEFRGTADSRGTNGDIVSEGHVYAVLKDDSGRRCELADVRGIIAEIYEVRHGAVPSRTVLGDAMTVLKAKARKAKPDETRVSDPAGELLDEHGITPGGEGWDHKDAAKAYEVRGGSLGWHKPMRDGGTLWTPMATFDAEIIEETVRDDSAEQTLTWTVRVTAADGRMGEVRVLPDQLGRPQQWAARAVGVSALVMPGPATADHVRAAVQARSTSATRKTVYTHTGWRRIDGAWLYLTGGGAVGPGGLDGSVTVDLTPISGYELPEVTDLTALREAVRGSLALLDVAPARVMVPILAAVYRAPLPLPPDCTGWLYGPTETFKSEITALGQQHFGPGMHAKALPGSWTSTGNDLEIVAFMLDGALFVVDDYSPDAAKIDAQKRAAAADRLIRGSANRSGRGRLRADGTPRPRKPPRAQVLTSAEDVPPGTESMRNRTFVFTIKGGEVDLEKLTAAQSLARSGAYALAMAGYIQSIARSYAGDEPLAATLEATRDGYRDQAHVAGHPRCANNIASLALGWHEFLAFAEDIKAITAEERASYWSQAWRVLCEVGAEQETYRRDTDPVNIYLASLRAVISSKRAHVAARDGGQPANPVRWGWTEVMSAGVPNWRSEGELVGWVDGDDLFLDPDEALKLAREFADAAGQPLTTSKTKLHDSLSEKGVLASVETDRNGRVRKTTRHDVGGLKGKRVLHLTVTKFDADDGQ
jgi:hypothetical protein